METDKDRQRGSDATNGLEERRKGLEERARGRKAGIIGGAHLFFSPPILPGSEDTYVRQVSSHCDTVALLYVFCWLFQVGFDDGFPWSKSITAGRSDAKRPGSFRRVVGLPGF